jgi:hypothetical protein
MLGCVDEGKKDGNLKMLDKLLVAIGGASELGLKFGWNLCISVLL